jgi:hypothetical protein
MSFRTRPGFQSPVFIRSYERLPRLTRGELAGEQDGGQVLNVIRKHVKPDQRIFVGVNTPIDRHIEAP